MKTLLSYRVNELIWHNHVPNEHEDVDQYMAHLQYRPR